MPTTPKATLYLLEPSFEDTAYPGQRFFCRHGSLVEGVLSNFPEVRDQLQIERVAFPRPRKVVIDAIGEGNQALPVLVLPKGETRKATTGVANGRAFAAGAEAILATLAERHSIPVIHP
ncbi:MAG: DUF3088 domain-containing protein [Devosia sp.]|nr:DUF3088 domain-containing protein [Devosia sp.]